MKSPHSGLRSDLIDRIVSVSQVAPRTVEDAFASVLRNLVASEVKPKPIKRESSEALGEVSCEPSQKRLFYLMIETAVRY